MSLGTEFKAVETTVVNDAKVIFKDTENVLTTDLRPVTTNFLTKKVDIFGATIPVNKKYFKTFVEMASVAILAIGLVGTQVYLYQDHKKQAALQDGRTATLESLSKQVDTNLTVMNSDIIATNKQIASVDTAEKSDAARIAQIQAQLNAKLSPVHPTTAVTRKYFRKR
jgi:hypothetical protein